jgi:hypothetical protein
MRRGETVVILSKDQAVLFSETGLRSGLDGMGLVETLRMEGAEREWRQQQNLQFTQLFLGSSFCCSDDALSSLHMVAAMSIRQAFALVGWSPNRTLARLVSRGTLGDRHDLFSTNGNATQ